MAAYGVLPNYDVAYLDDLLLDDSGRLQVVNAEQLHALPDGHLAVWGNRRGVYVFPTTELIDWLKSRIGGRTAIEICAGHGAIARALGIVGTDSYIQTMPEMAALYRAIGQHPIDPPADIQKLEANAAVDAHHPAVVVAAFATQKYQPGDEGPPPIGSSVYGVDELSLLPKIETFLNIGNDQSHGTKRIRRFPFECLRFEWLFTRSLRPELNHICVWERSR